MRTQPLRSTLVSLSVPGRSSASAAFPAPWATVSAMVKPERGVRCGVRQRGLLRRRPESFGGGCVLPGLLVAPRGAGLGQLRALSAGSPRGGWLSVVPYGSGQC